MDNSRFCIKFTHQEKTYIFSEEMNTIHSSEKYNFPHLEIVPKKFNTRHTAQLYAIKYFTRVTGIRVTIITEQQAKEFLHTQIMEVYHAFMEKCKRYQNVVIAKL